MAIECHNVGKRETKVDYRESGGFWRAKKIYRGLKRGKKST